MLLKQKKTYKEKCMCYKCSCSVNTIHDLGPTTKKRFIIITLFGSRISTQYFKTKRLSKGHRFIQCEYIYALKSFPNNRSDSVHHCSEAKEQYNFSIDPFPKRHKLVHNGGFPKFEALYCRINMVNSIEIS